MSTESTPENESAAPTEPSPAQCWVCGCAESRQVMPSTIDATVTSDDFMISDSRYGRTARIVRCTACGFLYADPLPAGDLVAMYEGLVDPLYAEGAEGRIKPQRHIVSKCLKIAPNAKTLLDIGAGIGLMCRAAAERGLDSVGVEPSQWSVETARKQGMNNVVQGIFPHQSLAGRTFDVITLVDVIEHVSDPLGLVAEMEKALAPGGVMAIGTPNVGSITAKMLGRRWWHYRVAHIGYFKPRTMARLLDRAGLKISRQETQSWHFPIRYVAERLERYLPIGFIRRSLERIRLGRWFLGIEVPVNPLDSMTYYITRKSG